MHAQLGARRRVTLTTHIGQYNADPLPLVWGAADPKQRGAVVATMLAKQYRNAIGVAAAIAATTLPTPPSRPS